MIKLKHIKQSINEQIIQGINFDKTTYRIMLQSPQTRFIILKGKQKNTKISGEKLKKQFDAKTAEQKKGRKYWEYVRDGLKGKFLLYSVKEYENKGINTVMGLIDKYICELICASSNVFWHSGTDEDNFQKICKNITSIERLRAIDNGLRNVADAYADTVAGVSLSGKYDDSVIVRGNGKIAKALTGGASDKGEVADLIGKDNAKSLMGWTSYDYDNIVKFGILPDTVLRNCTDLSNGFKGLIEGELDKGEDRDRILINLIAYGSGYEYHPKYNMARDPISSKGIEFEASSTIVQNSIERIKKSK